MASVRSLASFEMDRLTVVPPYKLVVSTLRKRTSGTAGPAASAISQQLLEFLLRWVLECVPFDEAGYLSANPDVKQSIERGEVLSAQEHFCRYGYFEHRMGGTPKVDEPWYLATNPDVADAIRTGSVTSARDHYTRWGAAEWRAPNRESVAIVELWKSLLLPDTSPVDART